MTVLIGIVGAEAYKFTAKGEAEARRIIRRILSRPQIVLVSGRCPRGGVDIWAEERADEIGRSKRIFEPENRRWEPRGYKERNLLIAYYSRVVHCIAPDRIPGQPMGYCQHCEMEGHVQNGGCWTLKRASQGILHVVCN